jgi:hypothetical protein
MKWEIEEARRGGSSKPSERKSPSALSEPTKIFNQKQRAEGL